MDATLSGRSRRTPDEQRELLKQLAPYEMVESPPAAPVGSRVRALADEAEAALARVAETDTDVAALGVRRAAVQQRIDEAAGRPTTPRLRRCAARPP